ncbi:hypothetical protein Tco_0680682 [Tanacetum coccineum]|uniref:Uncharacterized protein n=1 Tax=Tanacetum coccineum TaxID=301880 RepID=A0ABQ4XL93_9ASTR
MGWVVCSDAVMKSCDAVLVFVVMALQSSGIESEVQDESSRPGNDTNTDDADIRPIYEEEPMAETIEQTTSLLPNNVDLKAQIQKKVFAIAALKNDLRKLKGNSVDTKFAKTSVLGKPVLQSLRNQSVVRQPNVPLTQHYLPKRRESDFANPDHMIASSSSRNRSKKMPRFSLNDMVHNHYLDEARKKTQERDRNSKTSMMPSARFQSTTDDSKPKPRSTNHLTRSLLVSKSSCVTIMAVPITNHSKNSNSFLYSKHFVCSTFDKCVFNANHDACITKLLKEVNPRAKIQSHKTRNSNNLVDQKSHTHKPGKLFDSCTGKDDSEPTHGSNVDIPNNHESKQTLDLSVGTSINVQKEQSFDLRVEVPTSNIIVMTLMPELESLFGPLFDEYFNGENQVVSKSFAVPTADASDKRQQQPDSTSSTSTLATTVTD